jgi:hypothetical protein
LRSVEEFWRFAWLRAATVDTSKEISDQAFLELSTYFNLLNNMQAVPFFCGGNRQVAFQVLLKPGEMACLPAGGWVQS